METNIGKLTATLSETDSNKINSLIDTLNANIQPAIKLTSEDVHIRCMYIVSEELNSYGGRFPLDELYRIKELIIDSPVLIGHKKDQLPVGRNFYAEVVEKDNTHWVKSYFYWLKSAENADDLQKNIDGGIIKECSIGFTFLMPECSICESDIRTCRHEQFRNYLKNGITQSCFFYYKEIDKVLETSLVYRGAVPNTSISNELLTNKNNSTMNSIEVLQSLDDICEQDRYMLTPRYIGLDVLLTTTQNSIKINSFDNVSIPRQLIKKYFREYPKNLTDHFAQLIGYRGKERCSLSELRKFISGEKSIVKRVELRLLPAYNILKSDCQNIHLMRYKIVQKNEIDKISQSIMTKDGVRIWSLLKLPPYHFGYLYHPMLLNQKEMETKKSEYVISYDSNQNTILSVVTANEEIHLCIKRFTQKGFIAGKRFLAEKIEFGNIANYKKTKQNSGEIKLFSETNDSIQLELDGLISGSVIIQLIILHGVEQYQLYKYN